MDYMNFKLALALFYVIIPGRMWIRGTYEDAFVVARSEAIVKGHLKEGVRKYIAHVHDRPDVVSGEYEMVLVVTEVIKGDLKVGEIPITLHYGLTPHIGGQDSPRKSTPKGTIEIWDTGNSAVSPQPLIADARHEHLWFLRKRSGIYGREPGAGKLGVVDPEDMSPVSLKDYYLAYMTRNPEARLKALVGENSELAKRTQKFLEATDLKATLAEDHPWIRAKGLLLSLIRSHGRQDIDKVTFDKAGAELIASYESTQLRDLRGDIINVWASLRYEPGIDVMIRTLEKLDSYWTNQKLENGWFDSHSRIAREQQKAYSEMCHAVIALRKIGNSRAKAAVVTTRSRWAGLSEGRLSILKECDAALEAFSKPK